MQRRRYAPLLAVSLMASMAPALAVAAPASAAPGAAAQGAATTTAASLDRFTQQKLSWKRCSPESPASYQCATLTVPLDYARPSGPTTKVAVSRIKATDPAKRRGVLLLNPGGPGGSGTYMPELLRMDAPKSLLARFDAIGFDPRGVGDSSPVSCGLTEKDSAWPRPYKAATFSADVAWAKSVAEKCRKKSGDRLGHITTRNTARDMDVLRAVLKEKKISYLGYSYGTYLGAVYAQMFPQRADRFVLDSAVDPKRAWRGMIQVWAEGAEPAYQRWTEWTAKRNKTYKLGDTPAKVDKTFWDLVARADRKPIVVEGEKVDGYAIRNGIRQALFYPRDAAQAIRDLKKVADQPAAKRSGAIAPSLIRPAAPRWAAIDPALENMEASFWAVACGDNTAAWPKDSAQYRKDALRDKKRYPIWGDFGSNILPCAFWKKSLEPATVIDNKVGALVVQNEWDSQTPLSTAVAMHKAMKGSKMVTVKGGEGHGVYLGGNACADAATTSYLTTGKLPSANVTCTAGKPTQSRLLAPSQR
ncbi:alpha/beta hydrolase [Streptomyces sp. NPDC057638]|uniref:alpha/beta hydrolase n=1 Tax=Streptomyces sp. NPDC057638 TaxID=3346190 RepID=UPI00368232FB